MKILVFPNGLENPYQELLYQEMRREGNLIRYVQEPVFLLPSIIFWRLRGYTIFHLHWAGAFKLRFRRLTHWHYISCLNIIKLLGYKLVWTAHNVLPHEPVFTNDVMARRKLVSMADLVIAHSSTTLKSLEKIGIIPKRSDVIPAGSYIGAYPNTITRKEARKKLGIKEDTFVYLYLGQVRGYKGVDDLVESYEKVKSPKNQLIIAGKGSSTGYIADDDLQIYFNAADVVVLPYKKIATSGSALLAFSFGKAVIVPRLGDLEDLPEEISYKYSPEEPDGLVNAMKEAEENISLLHKKSEAALEYAKKLSWPKIAKQTHDAMQKLFINQ